MIKLDDKSSTGIHLLLHMPSTCWGFVLCVNAVSGEFRALMLGVEHTIHHGTFCLVQKQVQSTTQIRITWCIVQSYTERPSCPFCLILMHYILGMFPIALSIHHPNLCHNLVLVILSEVPILMEHWLAPFAVSYTKSWNRYFSQTLIQSSFQISLLMMVRSAKVTRAY